MNWILASGSPRRRELLEMLGVPDLTIRPAKGPERATPGAGPEQTVRELSLHKAQEVAQTCAPEDIIIAADTIVYLDGAILGKPRDHDDAVRMLTALSGREHIVYTGVAVLRGGELRQAAERTAVRFRPLTSGATSPPASRWTRPALTAFRAAARCSSRIWTAIIST